MSKSLKIEVCDEDLENLKRSGYRLCLAKTVQGCPFSIVWYAYVDFFQTNVFRWAPVYEIFAVNSFRPGEVLISSTGPVEIGLGQQSTLDENGSLCDAVSGGPSDAFSIINRSGPAFPGINQRAKGIDGNEAISPNFVTKEPIMNVSVSFIPAESIMVWFMQDIESGTMFDRPPQIQSSPTPTPSRSLLQRRHGETFAIEVDFTQKDGQSITYEKEDWSPPELWVDPGHWDDSALL